MKKETLIQKIQERFSNLPQDVAVVVNYKGEKYSVIPNRFSHEGFINRTTVDKIKPFYYGEIIEEQQELCANPEFQYLTFRAEAGIDVWTFAYECSANNELVQFHSFQLGNNPIYGNNFGKLFAPSHLSLPQIKLLMWELADKYSIPNVHVLIQSVDYPVFEGHRDRDSPQPNK